MKSYRKIDLANYKLISFSHRTPQVSSELVHRDNEKARDRSTEGDVNPSAGESYICRRNFMGKTPSHKFAEVVSEIRDVLKYNC